MRCALSIFLIFLIKSVLAQKLPVIKANSEKVSIRENGKLFADAWRIVPSVKPDIHITNSTGVVTFITDVDSMVIKVNKTTAFNFIILYKGKDSALTQVKYEPGALEKLKAAAKYDYTDTKALPDFIYQESSFPKLKELKDKYNLDAVAGNASELSKILNLLKWVHQQITHDGQHNNPSTMNALQLLDSCKATGRGLNCRGFAVVLNEVYLSMGFKSRLITLESEVYQGSAHALNAVYSQEKQKWLWVDAEFGAYLMDEKGELLSPAEVRERIIQNKTIIVNPDASWNRKIYQTYQSYIIEFVAPLLYKISAAVSSEYDYESWTTTDKPSYIYLLPANAKADLKKYKETKLGKNGKYTMCEYVTTNPNLFWVKPK